MANYVLDKGYVPDGSDAAVAYRFCVLGSDDQHIDLTPTNGQMVLGVLMQNADVDEVVAGSATLDVRLKGIAPVTVGTTNVLLNDEVMTQTDGRTVPITGTGARVAGIALEAGTTGGIINVLLTPAGRVNA
jgi:hypothetical protein